MKSLKKESSISTRAEFDPPTHTSNPFQTDQEQDFKLYRCTSFSSNLSNDYDHISEQQVEDWLAKYDLDQGAKDKFWRTPEPDRKRIVAHGDIVGSNKSAALIGRVCQLNQKKKGLGKKGVFEEKGYGYKGGYGYDKGGYKGKGWFRESPYSGKSGWGGGGRQYYDEWESRRWGDYEDFADDHAQQYVASQDHELLALKIENVPPHVSEVQVIEWFGHHAMNIDGDVVVDRNTRTAYVEFKSVGYAVMARNAMKAQLMFGQVVDVTGPVVKKQKKGDDWDQFLHLALQTKPNHDYGARVGGAGGLGEERPANWLNDWLRSSGLW